MTEDAKAKREFQLAFSVLLSRGFPEDKFIVLAMRVPCFAAVVLEKDMELSLMQSPPATAQTILHTLWKIKNPTDFIRDMGGRIDPHSINFLLDRLANHAGDFSTENLVALTRQEFLQKIRSHASQLLGARLESIADSIGDVRGISLDIDHLKQSVRSYGFHADLNESLDKVRSGLDAPGDGFDQAAMLKTLRTFMEHLLAQVAGELHRKRPDLKDRTNLAQCQNVIDHLEQKGVTKKKLSDLGRALYGILSGEGVHALKAERDYVRFCWNFTVEYAKIILFELERKLAEPPPVANP